MRITEDKLDMKHTPGPWHVNNKGYDKVFIDYSEKDLNSGEVYTHSICKVFDAVNPNQTTADATLISAAPEMLEALYQIRDLMLKVGLVNYDNGRIYNKTSEAIEKAIKLQ